LQWSTIEAPRFSFTPPTKIFATKDNFFQISPENFDSVSSDVKISWEIKPEVDPEKMEVWSNGESLQITPGGFEEESEYTIYATAQNVGEASAIRTE
jgi:subtilase family serine protease